MLKVLAEDVNIGCEEVVFFMILLSDIQTVYSLSMCRAA